MGIFETAAFVIHGGFDVFDKANGLISKIREGVMAADDDDYPMSIHTGGGPFDIAPHFGGGKESVLAQLDECKQKIDEVCLTCQEIMASLP